MGDRGRGRKGHRRSRSERVMVPKGGRSGRGFATMRILSVLCGDKVWLGWSRRRERNRSSTRGKRLRGARGTARGGARGRTARRARGTARRKGGESGSRRNRNTRERRR